MKISITCDDEDSTLSFKVTAQVQSLNDAAKLINLIKGQAEHLFGGSIEFETDEESPS